MILTTVSFLFLARTLKGRRGGKSAPDDLPAAAGHKRADPSELVLLE